MFSHRQAFSASQHTGSDSAEEYLWSTQHHNAARTHNSNSRSSDVQHKETCSDSDVQPTLHCYGRRRALHGQSLEPLSLPPGRILSDRQLQLAHIRAALAVRPTYRSHPSGRATRSQSSSVSWGLRALQPPALRGCCSPPGLRGGWSVFL